MPFDNIASEILEFVDRYIGQFAAWDVLVYFHENPDTEHDVSAVALDIGRRVSQIEECLASFVEMGIITCDETSQEGEQSYRYTASPEFRGRMDAFIAACRDRTNRLAIVSRILQKEAKRI